MLGRKKKQKQPEDLLILKLENDIESTDTNKSAELESFWANVNGLQSKEYTPKFSFEIISNDQGAGFYFAIPKQYKNIICKKLNATYPYIDVSEVEDPLPEAILNTGDMGNVHHVHSCELVLTEHESLTLKTKGAEKTFLNTLLNTMNHFGEEETSIVQITIKPLPEKWNLKAEESRISFKKGTYGSNKVIRALMGVLNIIITGLMMILDTFITKGQLNKSFSQTSVTKESSSSTKESDSKFKRPCFNISVRVATRSKDPIVAEQTVKSISTVFKSELNDANKFQPITINIQPMLDREITSKHKSISTLELAQFAHLPGKNVSADNIMKSGVKTPYDKNIPSKGVVFGFTPQNNDKPVAFPMVPISLEKYQEIYDEFEKMIDNICKPRLILGQMGTGKSEWIINYTLNLIRMGIAVVVVDPKNDTQKRLIESMPLEYLDKIDYLNLGDLVYPPALNLLRRRMPDDPTEMSLIVQSLINFFKKEFGRSWGFAMQQLIMMTGNAILLEEVATLYEFQLMMTNKEYRGRVIEKMSKLLEDESRTGKAMLKELYQFWTQFHKMTEKDQMARISSTMNKVGVFMSNRIIRAIVSQRESYDFRKAGDMGRITIVNIPDGELGDENTRLLASFINKAIWLDYRSRANISIDKRYPTVWLIEEAHMVMDEEFIPVLTQSRGYRLGVTILTQGLTNFENRGMKELKELILTNCKNKIVFRVGPQDARILAEEFAPLTPFDLMNCPDYHFYSKILLDGGVVSDVFYAKALLPAEPLRSYDKYKETHRSGKLTIDEVEDQIDDRHKLSETTVIMNLGMEENSVPEEEEEKPKRRKRVELQFME